MEDINDFFIIKDSIGMVGNELFTTDNIKISTNFKVHRLNSIVKTAILAVLAGYKQNNNIVVFDSINLKKFINIEKFIDLNLNFKGKAPREFNVSIAYKNKNYPIKIKRVSTQKGILQDERLNNYDTLLLLSGGIDSTGGLLYCMEKKLKVLPLWIDFGQKNRYSEKKVIKLLKDKLNIPILEIRVGLEDYVNEGWTQWKQGIIPARNFLFLALASLFILISTQEKFSIYLCASRGEINSKHNDKSPVFYKMMSKLLSLYTRKKIKAWTPFYKYNKAEIIAIWQKKWYPKYGISIKDTTTCYLGNNCGVCSACYYRCINTIVAGVKDIEYKTNPFKDKGRIIRDYYIPNFDKWGQIRKIDFLIALSRNQNLLPIEVREFYNNQSKLFTKEIKERIENLNN